MSTSADPRSITELQQVLEEWTPVRRITALHVHTMLFPTRSAFRGRSSIEAMRLYHRKVGMADTAQHLTIDPEGFIWSGRPFDAMPASVAGHNGTAKAGPIMLVVVLCAVDGQYALHDDQEKSLKSVCRALLEKSSLDASEIRFHVELNATSTACPGPAIDPEAFRASIAALLTSNTLSAFDVRIPREIERGEDSRAMISPPSLHAEASFLQLPESTDALAEQRVLADLIARGAITADAIDGARGISDEYRDLLGHVVNTSQGILSGKGAMQNTSEDLDTLIRDHLTPAFESGQYSHLMFYAHGGLVGEHSALNYARTILPWWKSHGVYPIFFVWESGLFESIWQKPRGVRGFDDFWDKGVEVATQLFARKIWSNMKANARRCSDATTEYGQPGGLYEFAERLAPWLAARRNQLQLHAVGHSTGPILLSRFMPLLLDRQFRFETLSYLAPAIRTDDFAADVQPEIGAGISRLRAFAMSDKAERDDDVAHIYRKSLLYYVRDACEDTTKGRILGLQQDLLADRDLASAFGLTGKTQLRAPQVYDTSTALAIEFSQRQQDRPLNARTTSQSHGGFDNDPATLLAVLDNIWATSTATRPNGKPFPTEADFERAAGPADAGRAFASEDDSDCNCCRCTCSSKGQAHPDSAFDRTEEDDADEFGDDADATPSASLDRGPILRRLAVCVGIDKYGRDAALKGCVNDSKDWAARLTGAGFTVTSLHDAGATRAEMLGALKRLVDESRRGDELVFQFAGHGTQVPDLDGDEVDRFDEALVPFDFRDGHLLTDDDIYAACAPLRDRPGVALTFFMDCCNSGSNTRAAAIPALRTTQRVRYLRLSSEVVKKFTTSRARGSRAPAQVRRSEDDAIPGVVSFAACLDHEFAYETDGRGDFTRNAETAFQDALRKGATNQAFITQVVRQFGANRRQNPTMLNPAAGLRARPFLGGRS